MKPPADGEAAPDFSLRDQHGQTVRLADFRDVQNVVLMFYPFAFSGVCSGELAEVRDRLGDLHNDSSKLLAVSCDTVYALRIFAGRDSLDFPLLSDFWPHGAVSASYGVFNDSIGASSRSTFIIDRGGVVRWQVHNELGEARDLDEYIRVLDTLR